MFKMAPVPPTRPKRAETRFCPKQGRSKRDAEAYPSPPAHPELPRQLLPGGYVEMSRDVRTQPG